jgi:hypothetical protein
MVKLDGARIGAARPFAVRRTATHPTPPSPGLPRLPRGDQLLSGLINEHERTKPLPRRAPSRPRRLRRSGVEVAACDPHQLARHRTNQPLELLLADLGRATRPGSAGIQSWLHAAVVRGDKLATVAVPAELHIGGHLDGDSSSDSGSDGGINLGELYEALEGSVPVETELLRRAVSRRSRRARRAAPCCAAERSPVQRTRRGTTSRSWPDRRSGSETSASTAGGSAGRPQ